MWRRRAGTHRVPARCATAAGRIRDRNGGVARVFFGRNLAHREEGRSIHGQQNRRLRLGKGFGSFVVATIDDRGAVTIHSSDHQSHEGKPLELFRRWYLENNVASCAALGATGIYADDLVAPVLVLPADSCQEAALELDTGLQGRSTW